MYEEVYKSCLAIRISFDANTRTAPYWLLGRRIEGISKNEMMYMWSMAGQANWTTCIESSFQTR